MLPEHMRKFVIFLLLFLGATFFYLSFGELENVVATLRSGNIAFLLLGILFQVGWCFAVGYTYQSLYRLFDIPIPLYRTTLLSSASDFVNAIAPSAGISGIAVFISDANRKGYPSGKVTIIGMLFVLIDYIAFLSVLALGLIVLFRRNDLDLGEMLASAVMLAIALTLGFLFYLGSRSADALGRALAWMTRLVNRIVKPFLRRDYLDEARAHTFAREIATDLKALPQKKNSLLVPLLSAFTAKVFSMLVLTATFLAFNASFSVGTIVGGFSISYLFLIISPTPSGVGIVEGVMPLALSSLHVPLSQAVVITLAYRGVTFWVMLGVGAIALHLLERR